jgi:hypothetical protein
VGDHNAAARRLLLKHGKALPGKDGGPPRFPINDVSDLRSAVRLAGQVPASEQAKVKRHIRKHAKRLNAMSVIPDGWSTSPPSSSSS